MTRLSLLQVAQLTRMGPKTPLGIIKCMQPVRDIINSDFSSDSNSLIAEKGVELDREVKYLVNKAKIAKAEKERERLKKEAEEKQKAEEKKKAEEKEKKKKKKEKANKDETEAKEEPEVKAEDEVKEDKQEEEAPLDEAKLEPEADGDTEGERGLQVSILKSYWTFMVLWWCPDKSGMVAV